MVGDLVNLYQKKKKKKATFQLFFDSIHRWIEFSNKLAKNWWRGKTGAQWSVYTYIFFFLLAEKIFVCLFVPTQRCKYRGGGSVNHSQGAIFPNFSGKIRLVDYRRGEAWRRPFIVSTASNPRSSPLHGCALDPFLLPLWIERGRKPPRTRRSRPRLLSFCFSFLVSWPVDAWPSGRNRGPGKWMGREWLSWRGKNGETYWPLFVGSAPLDRGRIDILLCRRKTGLDCCVYDDEEEEMGDPLLWSGTVFIEGCNINLSYEIEIYFFFLCCQRKLLT